MPSNSAGGRGGVKAAPPGSSSQAAIELLDEEDSNDSGSAGGRRQQGAAKKGNGARTAAEPRRRAGERKRPENVNKPTRPTPTLGPGGTAASAAAVARRRRRSETSSSDSDAYVVVAVSRAPSAAPALGTGKRSSLQDEPSSKRRRNGNDTDKDKNGKGRTKGKERQVESRKKADVVTIEEGSEEEEDGLDLDENQTQPGPSKPSFKDRLSQNLHSSPRFSKAFKGKVKSSNSISMPLADDRFESDEDEEGDGYESADKPSPRKKRASKLGTKQSRLGAKSSRRSRNASDAENDPSVLGSDAERVSIRSSTDDEATAPAAGRLDARSDAEELSDLPEALTAAAPSRTQAEHRRRSLDKLSASRKEKDRRGHKKEKQKQRVVDSPEPSPGPGPARANQPSSRRAVVVDDEEESESAELPSISPKARTKTSKPLFVSDHEDEEDDSAVELLAGNATGRGREQGSSRSRHEQSGTSSKRKKDDKQRKKRKKRAERDSSGSSSSAPRVKKKTKKAKARLVASSSSASSSSSAGEGSDSDSSPDATLNRLTRRHEAESEEDIDEELENLKMDYDHVQAEKLRPKDDAKERRLDKLRAARAAKEQREERRKKGIVESDHEQPKPGSSQQAPQRVDSSSSEDDSDIDSVIPNLDDDDKDFIVQDGTSWEVEKTKVAKHLPPEIQFGSRDLEEHFETFISYLVYKYIFANKSWVDESDEFRFALLALEKEIDGTINSGIASSIWKEEFRAALDARPELYMREIEYTNGCEGCNKHDRTASQEATISGPTYDRDSFEDDSDEEEPPQVFLLGRFCAEKCVLAHDLKHFQYRTHNRIHELCAEHCRLPVKIPGDREERDRVRGHEARRIIKILGQGNFPEVKQMWAELDQALQRARRVLQ